MDGYQTDGERIAEKILKRKDYPKFYESFPFLLIMKGHINHINSIKLTQPKDVYQKDK